MSAYALDTGMAREGSGSAGGRIEETGAYNGKIEWARENKNQNGTSYIELRFVDELNQHATLTLYTMNSQGENLRGMKQIHALMACLRIRNMNAVPGEVEAWDFDQKQVTKQQSMVLPELANRPIGLVLQKEFYQNQSGEQKDQMNLFAPFTTDTRQLAREVLDNKGESIGLDKIVETIKDRYRDNVRPIQQTQPGYHAPNAQEHAATPAADEQWDDIPF